MTPQELEPDRVSIEGETFCGTLAINNQYY